MDKIKLVISNFDGKSIQSCFTLLVAKTKGNKSLIEFFHNWITKNVEKLSAQERYTSKHCEIIDNNGQ